METEMVVFAGWQSTHYHKPKWVVSKLTHKEILSTVCGRDSRIYDIHLFPRDTRHIMDRKPCKICYKLSAKGE